MKHQAKHQTKKHAKHASTTAKHTNTATGEAAFLAAAAKRWLALRAAHGLTLQSLIRQQKGR